MITLSVCMSTVPRPVQVVLTSVCAIFRRAEGWQGAGRKKLIAVCSPIRPGAADIV